MIIDEAKFIIISMDKEYVILEIKNKSLKLLVGYIFDNKIKVIYRKKAQLSVPLKDGDVLDVGTLSSDISNAFNSAKEDLKNRYNLKDVILVLPPFGLEVYNSNKITNTVSPTPEINNIDVKNVHFLIEKESVPNSNTLVCIVPNYFKIDNDNTLYRRAPLGMKSNTLSLNANVYTLPFKMVDDIKRAVLNANLSINKTLINTLCIASLEEYNNFKEKSYIYIDVGSKNTTLSLIGNCRVCGSTFFDLGLDNLTESIMNEFSTNLNKATELRDIFGLDESRFAYNPAIAKTIKDGNEIQFTRDNLNTIVNSFVKEWNSYLNNSIKCLMKDNLDSINLVPLVFNGNGLKLKGLKDKILINFVSNTVYFLETNVVGANPEDYASLLGAIILSKELDDNYKQILRTSNQNNNANLTRVGGN